MVVERFATVSELINHNSINHKKIIIVGAGKDGKQTAKELIDIAGGGILTAL